MFVKQCPVIHDSAKLDELLILTNLIIKLMLSQTIEEKLGEASFGPDFGVA